MRVAILYERRKIKLLELIAAQVVNFRWLPLIIHVAAIESIFYAMFCTHKSVTTCVSF